MSVPDGLVSTVVEVVGLVLLVVAAWLWDSLAGVAALGAVLVLLGYVLGARSSL